MIGKIFSAGLANKLFVLIVIILAILSVTPLYWMFVNSLKPNVLTIKIPPDIIPKNANFNNYKYLFTNTNVLHWLFNSIFVSSITTVFIVYLSALAGYPLAKKVFPGGKIFFWIAIIFMTIPRQVLLLPLFVTITRSGLYDSYIALILPRIAWPFGVFLMKQLISTVPGEIFEAAKIDGCSELQIFHKILLPIIKPGLASLAIFAFTYVWNDYMWQLVVISSDIKKPLPLGVATLSEQFIANYGLQMAAASLGAIPLIIVFAAFQKYFTRGITIGAVKG